MDITNIITFFSILVLHYWHIQQLIYCFDNQSKNEYILIKWSKNKLFITRLTYWSDFWTRAFNFGNDFWRICWSYYINNSFITSSNNTAIICTFNTIKFIASLTFICRFNKLYSLLKKKKNYRLQLNKIKCSKPTDIPPEH